MTYVTFKYHDCTKFLFTVFESPIHILNTECTAVAMYFHKEKHNYDFVEETGA